MRIHKFNRIFVGILSALGFAVVSMANLAFAVVGGPVIDPVFHSGDQEFFLERTVQIRIKDKYGSRTCSGVISNSREVLFAGHCIGPRGIYTFDASEYETQVLVYDPKSPTKYREIPGYEGKVMFSAMSDLALVRLVEDAPLKSSTPLAFAKCDDDIRVIAGFGINGENRVTQDTLPTIAKQTLWAAKVPAQVDQLRMSSAVELSETESAGIMRYQGEAMSSGSFRSFRQTSKARACFGDSGGPIFCKSQGRWAVAAVTGTLAGASLLPARPETAADKAFPEKKLKPEEKCSTLPFVTATKLSETMHILEQLRDQDDFQLVFGDHAGPAPAGTR